MLNVSASDWNVNFIKTRKLLHTLFGDCLSVVFTFYNISNKIKYFQWQTPPNISNQSPNNVSKYINDIKQYFLN